MVEPTPNIEAAKYRSLAKKYGQEEAYYLIHRIQADPKCGLVDTIVFASLSSQKSREKAKSLIAQGVDIIIVKVQPKSHTATWIYTTRAIRARYSLQPLREISHTAH
jgi:hypothetical protein